MRFISFSGPRLKTDAIAIDLPEIVPGLQYFRRKSADEWFLDMSRHNQECKRAIQMGICPLVRKEKFLYSSLDQYMIQMRSERLIAVLDSLSVFAERLVPLINDDNDAHSWRINRELLIHRHHLIELSRRVLSTTTVIDELTNQNSNAAAPALHEDKLISSLWRLSQLYSTFAASGEHTASQLHPSRSNAVPERCPTHYAKRQRISEDISSEGLFKTETT